MTILNDMEKIRKELRKRELSIKSELKGINDAIRGLDLAIKSAGGSEPAALRPVKPDLDKLLDKIDENDYIIQRAGVVAVRHIMSHEAVAITKLLTVVRSNGYKMNRGQLNSVLLRFTKIGIPIRAEGKGKNRVFMMDNN